MAAQQPDGNVFPSAIIKQIRDLLLKETRGVASNAVTRLRQLRSLLPAGVVEQVEKIYQNPGQERRNSLRLADSASQVKLQVDNYPGAALKDHNLTGMAIFLPCQAEVGTILHCRTAQAIDQGCTLLEVKHCHKEGEGWVAGCEILSERPPPGA